MVARSARCRLLNIAHFVLALNKSGNTRIARVFQSLYAVRSHRPWSPRPHLSGGRQGTVKATKIQARRRERLRCKRIPRACAHATVDLEADPDSLPENNL
jgi:hypothetical protein